MAQFVGKWKTDTSSYTNFDEYCKATGLSDGELIQKLRTSEGWADFQKNNDGTWTCKYSSDMEEGEKVINFTPGKQSEFEFMGKKVKFLTDFVSDSKMTNTESSEMSGWKEEKITREVKGDIMECTHTTEGVEMTVLLRRIK